MGAEILGDGGRRRRGEHGRTTATAAAMSEMIVCDAARCGGEYATAGAMAAHHITDHYSRPWEALSHARQLIGLETAPPTWAVLAPVPMVTARRTLPPRRAFLIRPPAPQVPTVARASPTVRPPRPCSYCVRVAPELCHLHGGPSHSSTFKRKNAATCLICQRVHEKYGTACALHGGPNRGRYLSGAPARCRVCARMHSKDGMPCNRHGGPSRR